MIVTVDAVTISLPYYRTPETIRRAVDSILAQTFPDFVLVVVNDGAGPECWRPLEDVSDRRLIRFDLHENRGRYYADAVTLAACETGWWTCHDSDDWSAPDRLEKLVDASPGVDVVFGGYRLHKRNGKHRDRIPDPELVDGNKPLRHVAHHTALFRTDALRSIGGPHPGYRVAWDTFLVGVAVNRLRYAVVEEPLYHYEQRSRSLSLDRETGMESQYRHRVHQERLAAWRAFRTRGELPTVSPELRADVESDANRLRSLLAKRSRAVA